MRKGIGKYQCAKQDRGKLAFYTPERTYQWVVMPFGVQNAPSIFTRLMRRILEPLRDRGVSNFMDDILIATEIWAQHLESMTAVL